VPLITVVLPTYDRLQYLPQTIDSVMAQSFADFELLIADDGSGAETQAYLDGLLQVPRIRILRLPHTANPGAVRNRAIRAAGGEFIAFIDSDDVWLPGKLETQLAALRATPACKWSYSEFAWVDAAGQSIDWRRNPARTLFDGQVFEPLLRRRAGIALPTVMTERALLERAGGFDEQLLLHEDYDLWLRLALLSPTKLVPQALTRVRRHDQHFSRSGIPLLLSRARVLEKLQGLLGEAQQLQILRSERARLAADLAWAHGVTGRPGAVLGTLAHSWRYSWRSWAWYVGGLKSLLRSVMPDPLVSALRSWRGARR
jgi:glycosyltransferase involved in cell wall biosynthesis